MIKGFKTINLLLILITIVAGGWLVNIWSDPVEIPTLKGAEIKTPPEVATEAVIPLPFHYNVIVNKNLFRSSRKRYVAKVKPPLPPPPPAPTPAPPPPPKRPIPKFSLYGTIILKDKDDMAIISTNMQNRKPVTYHNGDEIEEGFVLKEIHSNKVVLERAEDKEVVEVSFKAPSLSTARPGTRSPASRPRPPMRRRENRRNNLGTPVMPFPEPIPPPPISGMGLPQLPPQFSGSQGKTTDTNKVLRGTSSTTFLPNEEPTFTYQTTTSQSSDNTENGTTDTDNGDDTSPSPPTDTSGETTQGGDGDIPSPSQEGSPEEMPPSLPTN
ncbi:MAG: hypothetical protein ACE5IH_03045 [Thermodesulfobacteriota bacterium]